MVHALDILGDGKLLLEISINPQRDEAYVGDRSHIEGVLPDKTNIPEKYCHKSLEEGERAFGEISFSLPEVVIFNRIPPERIEVSQRQPLIEEDLVRLRCVKKWFTEK